MTIQAASATLPRIDNIVLRLDVTLSGLNIDLYAVTGTAAATPTAPALTRNASVWELCLATISVPAAATSVPQNRITDTRLDSTKCGVVASIIGDTNTSTYYAQIQADLASFRTVEQVVFNDWFAALQVTLSGDVAANLAAQIANLTPTLLWTNPAPSSAFGAQTVSVDLSAYSKIRIETKSSTTRRGRSYDVYIGETAQMDMLANGYVGLRTAAVSASGVVFSGGSLYLSYAGTLTANYDSYAIPTKIFGIK